MFTDPILYNFSFLLRFSTCNQADFDTQISVFSGDCPDDLECLDSQDSTLGCADFTVELGTNLAGDDTYFVLVHGFEGASGIYNLTVTTGSCRDAGNDDCEKSEEIPFQCDGPPLVFSGDTSLAPIKPFEPSDCGSAQVDIGAPGAWYNLVVPEDVGVVPVT